MSQKQVMPKSEDLSRSLEINAIRTFDTEFPTIFNKSCTYITFKSAVKHGQLGYGYPRGQTQWNDPHFSHAQKRWAENTTGSKTSTH